MRHREGPRATCPPSMPLRWAQQTKLDRINPAPRELQNSRAWVCTHTPRGCESPEKEALKAATNLDGENETGKAGNVEDSQ